MGNRQLILIEFWLINMEGMREIIPSGQPCSGGDYRPGLMAAEVVAQKLGNRIHILSVY